MASSDTPPTRLRLAAARHRDTIPFDIAPDAEACAALARELGVSAIRKLRFSGRMAPHGHADWDLDATLGASIVQPCDITLAPVTTRIDEPVRRRYVAGRDETPEPAEREIPEDVDEEPLPAALDLEAVMAEALSLAVPAFPRRDEAAFGTGTYAAPGAEPIGDEDVKPFAGLRDALRREE